MSGSVARGEQLLAVYFVKGGSLVERLCVAGGVWVVCLGVWEVYHRFEREAVALWAPSGVELCRRRRWEV